MLPFNPKMPIRIELVPAVVQKMKAIEMQEAVKRLAPDPPPLELVPIYQVGLSDIGIARLSKLLILILSIFVIPLCIA